MNLVSKLVRRRSLAALILQPRGSFAEACDEILDPFFQMLLARLLRFDSLSLCRASRV